MTDRPQREPSHIRLGGPAMGDYTVGREDARRTAPWTPGQLEKVRLAALALVRTHRAVDAAGGEILTVVDGPAFWRLLRTLDRSDEKMR